MWVGLCRGQASQRRGHFTFVPQLVKIAGWTLPALISQNSMEWFFVSLPFVQWAWLSPDSASGPVASQPTFLLTFSELKESPFQTPGPNTLRDWLPTHFLHSADTSSLSAWCVSGAQEQPGSWILWAGRTVVHPAPTFPCLVKSLSTSLCLSGDEQEASG